MDKLVQFSPYAKPAILSGVYDIRVSQVLDADCRLEQYEVAAAQAKIAFDCDLVSMNEGEVYSVYPPKDSAGDFSDCLPHMVFHRKTLPWELLLNLDSCADNMRFPYVALLVVSEIEGVEELSGTYEETLKKPVNIYLPEIKDELVDRKQACRVIDIPRALWADILPYREDLPYLAHVKGVKLDDKVTDPEVKNEWFSCLIANRYPDSPSVGKEALKHTVYLVSLAGFEDYINMEPELRAAACGYDYIRMYVLYRYSFCVAPSAYDFCSLAAKLKAGTLEASAQKDFPDRIKELTQLGYVPVNHNFREGSRLVSWYRSPFLPGEIPYKENISYYFNSDQLLHYDPELGMFDITYSAAWQLGRMLALRNSDLTGQIYSWRLSKKQEAVKNQNFRLIAHMMEDSPAKEEQIRKGEYQEEHFEDTADEKTDRNCSYLEYSAGERLCNQLWSNMITDLHSICTICDPYGLRGTGVTAFSGEKVLKLEEKLEQGRKYSGKLQTEDMDSVQKVGLTQADLLINDK